MRLGAEPLVYQDKCHGGTTLDASSRRLFRIVLAARFALAEQDPSAKLFPNCVLGRNENLEICRQTVLCVLQDRLTARSATY